MLHILILFYYIQVKFLCEQQSLGAGSCTVLKTELSKRIMLSSSFFGDLTGKVIETPLILTFSNKFIASVHKRGNPKVEKLMT